MICSYQHEGSDDSSSLELRSDLSARMKNKHVILGIIQQICSIEVYRLTKMSSCYLLQKHRNKILCTAARVLSASNYIRV